MASKYKYALIFYLLEYACDSQYFKFILDFSAIERNHHACEEKRANNEVLINNNTLFTCLILLYIDKIRTFFFAICLKQMTKITSLFC